MQKLPYGLSSFTVQVDDNEDPVAAAFASEVICYTYKPTTYNGRNAIVTLHGTGRTDMRAFGPRLDIAEKTGSLLVSPWFAADKFVGARRYNQGRLRTGSEYFRRTSQLHHVLGNISDHIRSVEGADTDDYRIMQFGHSAGGEILSRSVLFGLGNSHLDTLVCSNPGIPTFPSYDLDFHWGLGGLPSYIFNEDKWRRALAHPLIIYAGSEDNEPDFLDCVSCQEQGHHRFERMLNMHARALEVAQEKGWPCNWKLIVAQGVGHTSTGMLAAPEMNQVLELAFGKREY